VPWTAADVLACVDAMGPYATQVVASGVVRGELRCLFVVWSPTGGAPLRAGRLTRGDGGAGGEARLELRGRGAGEMDSAGRGVVDGAIASHACWAALGGRAWRAVTPGAAELA
jgi:hypothetical protein